jgi:hypothetical protein
MDDQRNDRKSRSRRVMQIAVIVLAVLFWVPVTIVGTMFLFAYARPLVLLSLFMLGVGALCAAVMLITEWFRKPEK